MPTIAEIKEQAITHAPLILFECVLKNGNTERWSTHKVVVSGHLYQARVQRHNVFDMRGSSDDGIDSVAKVSIVLANADSYFSQIAQSPGWKGSRLNASFLFFNLTTGLPESESAVLFQGVGNAPEEIGESAIRLSFTNRLNLQRLLLPEVRIQKRCPWSFPATSAQRSEAVTGGVKGKYSPFFRCGYSAGEQNGLGNLNAGSPYIACEYTRAACELRGMFNTDSQANPTRRFGGIEFVPAAVLVRGHAEKNRHTSPVAENEARYNDLVPLNYGTVWVQPPVVFSRNDGNLTRMEVLIGAGVVERVLKVVVGDIDIPQGVSGTDMTATGWYNVVSSGTVTGGFNLDFTDAQGVPLGDPYGSMAFLSVVVPNRVHDGNSLPRVSVLLEGLRLPAYDTDGEAIGESFSNNPAWVLLDLLRRSGWTTAELDLASFAAAAAHCAEPISSVDLYGNAVEVPRYQCNLAVRRRRSAAELIRGVRNGAGLYLSYGAGGLLELRVEGSFALQHPVKPEGSNSETQINGGWPAYEFGDGSDAFTGILRRENGESSVRVWCRSTPETANRYSIEFQDQFNEYQQDSLSLVDVEDAVEVGQEVSAALPALGIPNFHQAARIIKRHIDKSIRGNLYIQFETSVRAIGLRPGDLITLTYLKEGFERQPFRITRIALGLNHREALIEAQIHSDSWYGDAAGGAGTARRQQSSGVTIPRPLVGTELDANQQQQFGVQESYKAETDGSVSAAVAVAFAVPAKPEATSLGIPYLSLAPSIQTTGGSLPGGRTYYYAVSAEDAGESESDLSFVVRAFVPSGTNTNRVTLTSLSFSAEATAFHVYRGDNPQQLLRIASGEAVSSSFTDTGLTPELLGPPDANFDHASFEWRLELRPETQASIYSDTTIGNSTLHMTADEHVGMTVRITAGKGKGQERQIDSNTATTLTVRRKWTVTPDNTSEFVISESSWRFGSEGSTSPLQFAIPNREGATIHISGVAVNAQGQTGPRELSPLTRWYITGATGSVFDSDVPPPPIFGLYPNGQGTLELLGVGFTDLTNTRTVAAGTLMLHYWDELASPTSHSLASAVDASQTGITLAAAGPAQAGDLIQVETEVMEVEAVSGGGTAYTVLRGSHGSTAASHASAAAVYHLGRKVFVIAFPKDFFGSPASGSFSYPIFLPDARIAAADFWVTNVQGNSETSKASFTATTEQGLRTLSGGQLTIQVEGHLAIQTPAAPVLVIEDGHSVRDIFAVVGEKPVGDDIELELRQDAALYCTLTIPDDAVSSNVVSGFGLPPLSALAKLKLNVVSVPAGENTTPGRDLTVTIRL